jgi:geranylgeranyl diphosphate synthase type I
LAVLASTGFDERLKKRAILKFSDIIVKTCYGQILDLDSEYRQQISQEDILLTHKTKTAIYTTEGPLHIGAILAGASDDQLKVLSNYAIPLGQAFQLHDDILGIFGDEKEIGKPAGSDLKEGKKTMLILKAYETGNNQQRNTIKNTLGNSKITPQQLESVRQLITDTKSLDYSRNMISSLVTESISYIKDSNLKEKEILVAIANYMVNRTN